jgi:hypothetical protein
VGPLHNGFLRGCPRCNITTHNLEDCRIKNLRDQEKFHLLVRKRHNRPPLEYSRDFRTVPGFGTPESPFRPWTRAFAAANAFAYESHVYRVEDKDEHLVDDPAWERPESIPSQALQIHRGRSRSRSPIPAAQNPIRNRTPPLQYRRQATPPPPQSSRQVTPPRPQSPRQVTPPPPPPPPHNSLPVKKPRRCFLPAPTQDINVHIPTDEGNESTEQIMLDRLETEVMEQDG